MQSAFSVPRPNAPLISATADENYGLKGLNLRDPDEIMPAGETPFTINSRMYARDESDSRVANRTRKGCSYLSLPVGQAQDTHNTATGSVGDLAFGDLADGTRRTVAQSFVAGTSGRFTQLDLEIRKASGSSGYVMIQIFTDKSGLPGDMIAEGSVAGNLLLTTTAFYSSYYIDAPAITSGSTYWFVVFIQDNGHGTYFLNQSTGSGIKASIDDGVTWGNVSGSGEVRYKTYISTAGEVKGWTTRYPSTGSNLILFAQLGAIYSASKSSTAVTQIDSGLNSLVTKVRFTQVDDSSIWVNGVDNARIWTGTGSPSNIPNIPAPEGTPPTNVIPWQNRLFFMTGVTRVDFTDLITDAANLTFSSVNFFYVPSPKSPDHMTGWTVFQDNLTIFTHETKHITIGSDISTFTRKEAIGTKGAVSQEAICQDRNFVYFMAPDGQIYRWNGTTDELLSDKVFPELAGIVDKTKVRLDIHNNQLRVYYAKNPSSVNNQMLLLDLELQQWFMDTGRPMQGCTDLYLDANELVEFGASVGQVYFGETQFSDLGKSIDWKYWTEYKTYAYRRRTGQTVGGGSAKKRIKRFRPVIRTADVDYTMFVGKDMDFANSPDMREYIVAGGGAKWGAFVWADGTRWGKTPQIDNLAGMSGRGKHIQYRFERRGVETPVDLYGYIALFKIGVQK